MTSGTGRRWSKVHGMTTGWLGLLLAVIGGCAGDPPKPAPAVSSDQVRSHADKSFEKLEQEERTRGSDSMVVP
jgi:hypothetical protein